MWLDPLYDVARPPLWLDPLCDVARPPPFVLVLGNAAVWCQWKRGDCVAWRRLQQDVSTSKEWTGKESQQRKVHVMKPVLVQKRRRCSASQVADFWKSFIEDLLRKTDYNIMGLLVESKPKPSPT